MPIDKRVLLTFFGTISTRGDVTTIGDLMAVYNVALFLRRCVRNVDIAWNGNLFDLTGSCVDINRIDKNNYDALIYVCGPLTAGHIGFFSQFSSVKKIAVGVSVTKKVDPYTFVDAIYIRDSDSISTFDLALADVGYPHFVANTKVRDDRVAVCLVGDQAEYGADDGYDKAEILVERITRGYQIVPVQTLLDPSRSIPASVELDLQCASSLITTRMHGALLAIYHGVPLISIDQIKGGAKVTRMMSQLEWPVFNAWTADPEEVVSEFGRQRRTYQSDHFKHSRGLLLKRSRDALEQSVEFILNELNAT